MTVLDKKTLLDVHYDIGDLREFLLSPDADALLSSVEEPFFIEQLEVNLTLLQVAIATKLLDFESLPGHQL